MSTFQGRVAAAFADPHLRTTLSRTLGRLTQRRDEAFRRAGTPFAELQAAARAIRQRSLADLPGLLEQLAGQVEAKGGVVFWAEDAAAASRYVVELAQARRVRRIVKAHSATAEEIGLNAALAAADLRATETQLGDYILQLAGDPPSHPVYTALHRRKEDVAVLFEEKLDMPQTLNVQAMAGMARFKLRREFLQADMGISGVNFAVAETGTLALASNAGNDRLASTLPLIHVAIMGIDKVVPTTADLFLLLQLLARSASGQPLTSYVNLIDGPARPDDPDGPQELHLIIVDNGRSRILRAGYGEALACIRCGACANACPVYREIGGQAYGGAVQGPIGAVVLPLMPAPAQPTSLPGALPLLRDTPFAALPQASTLCGACAEVCPVGIDLPDLLLRLRGDLNRAGRAARGERQALALWHWAVRDTGRYRLATRLLAVAGRLAGNPWIRHLPPPFHRWSRARNLPAPARRSFRERYASRQRA